MVGQLLKGVPREAADAALTAAGAPDDGRWADGGGAEAAEAALPAGSLAEAVLYATDCLKAEAAAAGGEFGSFVAAALPATGGGGGVEGVVELIAFCLVLLRPEVAEESAEAVAAAATLLLELLGAAPAAVGRRLHSEVRPMINLALGRAAGAEATQRSLCLVIAKAAASLPPPPLLSIMSELRAALPSPTQPCTGTNELRRAVGAALALGYIAAELEANGDGPRSSSSPSPPPHLAEVGTAVAAAVAELAALLAHSQHILAAAAASALGAAGEAAPRPRDDGAAPARALIHI